MTETTAAKSDKNELIHHAIITCSYLVRQGFRLILSEFAATIRRHSTDQRAEAVATALESATGFVVRDWRGSRANWQC